MLSNYKVAAVQAAPVFMDLEATIEKSVGLVEEAATNGAKLIAFPECWLPGYPWYIWLSAAAHNIKYFQRYHENSIAVGSEQFERICKAAADNKIFLSIGASERDYGSLYISQFLISDKGEVIKTRRKLKPTHMERTVFGDGNGSDLDVHETDIGRVGQLACWEHLQPLSKYAMYSMHEQVHVAAWPSFSCYPQAYSLSPDVNLSASRIYAVEGQCYVLAPSGVVSQEMLDLMIETPEQAELLLLGGGHARIFGPDGKSLSEPLDPVAEGLLYAEVDLGSIAIAKSFADPVGHYSRPDATALLLNRSNSKPVELVENNVERTYVETGTEADELNDELTG